MKRNRVKGEKEGEKKERGREGERARVCKIRSP